MNEAEAMRAVDQLLVELREAQETKDDADRRIAGLRKLVEGYLELYPLLDNLLQDGDLEPEQDDFGKPIFRPSGMEAALTVLKDNAGKWYAIPAIVSMLERRGWMPRSTNPRNAVRTALGRLVDQGLIKKTKSVKNQVVYQFPMPQTKTGGDFGYDEEPF